MNSDQSLGFDFCGDESLSGFRMRHLEVLNWGTFDRRVWKLNLSGRNGLLTGDIGSGKSTIVDAITTLFVPPGKITFNKAAGADKAERTLRSYVLGHYKSERNESTGASKPIGLRDENTYSVLSAVFHNEGYDQTITIAQVFYFQDNHAQPRRFYVAAERALSIEDNFANFGSDINLLKKRLLQEKCDVFDSFPKYGAWFRHKFGIGNEQAMELFYQTISMKSVGNLTEFVRDHMLKPPETTEKLNSLFSHFDALNENYQLVLKTKRQIEMLNPIVAEYARYKSVDAEKNEIVALQDQLPAHFAKRKSALLQDLVSKLDVKFSDEVATVEQLGDAIDQYDQAITNLQLAISNNGGDRLQKIEAEIDEKGRLCAARRKTFDQYESFVEILGDSPACTRHDFDHQQRKFAALMAEYREESNTVQINIAEHRAALKEQREQYTRICDEITSLKSRQSNIDIQQIKVRANICSDLGINEIEMPFAGELIQTLEGESRWEGAIERVLRNMGLSMLVPDRHYKAVSEWVDQTNLRGRFVYFQMREQKQLAVSPHENSLFRKVKVKPDSPYRDWLETELINRFHNLVCCETQDQFRRERRAITMAGQIKDASGRHEKDDRHNINDRSRFVLGWSNKEKIKALSVVRESIEREISSVQRAIDGGVAKQSTLASKIDALSKIEVISSFETIDWQGVSKQIEQLRDEVKRLESSSDVLKQMNLDYQTLTKKRKEAGNARDEAISQKSQTEESRRSARDQLSRLQVTDQDIDPALESKLDERSIELLKSSALSLENIDEISSRLQCILRHLGQNLDTSRSEISVKIVRGMSAFNNEFKSESKEFDANISAASEYEEMLARLLSDDFPRFEAKFKQMLNTEIINEIAFLNSSFDKERYEIRERIENINASLKNIDYNPGRYIALELQATQDAEIRAFNQDLKACTESSITGSDDSQYSEQKFLQVKRIIDRFRGREGSMSEDRQWVNKVTDMRNWFVFAASERWRDTDVEHEHYSNSGGKSGGQKEKLAYTVLAAGLAYQFELEWGAVRSKSFRFVVIDEAFGRGSEKSAQYGLELFKQLNLQLLIITPLQKIHVIEPFISSVGFVSNPSGQESRLNMLTIEQYQMQKRLIIQPPSQELEQ